jgi:hypothetical protein
MEDDLAKGPIACTSRYTLVWGTKPGADSSPRTKSLALAPSQLP